MGTLVALGACATHNPFEPKSAPNQLFQCAGGHQMIVALRDKGQNAAISFEGRNLSLVRIDENVDADVFTNNIYTLYLDDGNAVLEREGTPFYTGCSN